MFALSLCMNYRGPCDWFFCFKFSYRCWDHFLEGIEANNWETEPKILREASRVVYGTHFLAILGVWKTQFWYQERVGRMYLGHDNWFPTSLSSSLTFRKLAPIISGVFLEVVFRCLFLKFLATIFETAFSCSWKRFVRLPCLCPSLRRCK